MTYLLVNIGVWIIPLIFSFHPRLNFHREWQSTWLAIVWSALPFLLWDIYFTSQGIWGFNPIHLLGVDLLGLPLEEYGFFITIPYACLFTYHCFKHFVGRRLIGSPRWCHAFVLLTALVMLILGWPGWYTSTTMILLLIFYTWHCCIRRSDYLNLFLFSYGILTIPFFIVNGILTGTTITEEVVWYNEVHIIGPRILTIPMEDWFYGMLLILLNVTIFEYLTTTRRAAS